MAVLDGNLTALVNDTLRLCHTQFQYELALYTCTLCPKHTVDKRPMAVIVVLCLNFCGLDRCMLGQYCFGTLKAVTLGGCFVWWFCDHIVMLCNLLSLADDIGVWGFHATWEQDTIPEAFFITAVGLFLLCHRACQHCKRHSDKNADYAAMR